MNETYRKQVALLIRVMPYIAQIKDFAVHGGTAINLFHRNMERYSVDIDVTYIPLEDRDKSLAAINHHLLEVKKMIERAIPGIRVVHKPDVWKLQCTKDGFMLCLLGSDKPLVESLNPHLIDHSEALQQQFAGMTDVPFEYADYEKSRHNLINIVNDALNETDRDFFVSFEAGNPDWEKCCAGNLAEYPSVRWKLQNIANLKQSNPAKLQEGVEKLQKYLLG